MENLSPLSLVKEISRSVLAFAQAAKDKNGDACAEAMKNLRDAQDALELLNLPIEDIDQMKQEVVLGMNKLEQVKFAISLTIVEDAVDYLLAKHNA